VSRSWNVSSTADSISADSSADRHTARTSCAAPSRSPSLISTRASASRPTELAGFSRKNWRTVVPSCRSCHSLASARRRKSRMLGQSGLVLIKATPWELHSLADQIRANGTGFTWRATDEYRSPHGRGMFRLTILVQPPKRESDDDLHPGERHEKSASRLPPCYLLVHRHSAAMPQPAGNEIGAMSRCDLHHVTS